MGGESVESFVKNTHENGEQVVGIVHADGEDEPRVPAEDQPHSLLVEVEADEVGGLVAAVSE